MTPEDWIVRSMGDVLERVTKPISPDPIGFYREIGIRSHGKGVFHKGPVRGSDLGNKRVFSVEPNCLVINIVFAWEQAVAKTSSEEMGMIASHRFPMYQPKRSMSEIDFLLYYFRSKKGTYLLELASPGGAGRNKTLGQGEFARVAFAMPTVDEQRRIVKVLATWDKAVLAAERLVKNAKLLKAALLSKLLKRKIDEQSDPKEWTQVQLGDFVVFNPGPERLASDTQVAFVPMKAVSDDGQLTHFETATYGEVAAGHTSFKENDVLVAKISPCFENGKGAFVTGLDGCVGFGSTEFCVLRPRDEISAKLVYHIICSRRFRRLGELMMQGSAGQRRIPVDYLKKYAFFIPKDERDQIALVRVLDKCDQLVRSHQADLRDLRQQRRALMQQILTGKRRVKLDPAA